MDIVLYNKSLLNKKRVYTINTKTLVFVLPRMIQEGIARTELRFPHRGKIVDVYATCGVKGTSRTVIDVQTCAEEFYDNTPHWESIFHQKLSIEGNSKSSKTAQQPYVMTDGKEQVHANDHFRVSIDKAAEGMEDITVEIVVELDIEM